MYSVFVQEIDAVTPLHDEYGRSANKYAASCARLTVVNKGHLYNVQINSSARYVKKYYVEQQEEGPAIAFFASWR